MGADGMIGGGRINEGKRERETRDKEDERASRSPGYDTNVGQTPGITCET